MSVIPVTTPVKKTTRKRKAAGKVMPYYLEFFAGSGLVACALRRYFTPAWANDICAKKCSVYTANHGDTHFHLGSIVDVKGTDLPRASLAWASFPCQDLSLAGAAGGIYAPRSGLVWQWLRVLDEMEVAPPVLVAENVTGLVSTDGGVHYRALHQALAARGYDVGAVVLDAVRWVPQSRPRVFVIAVKKGVPIPPFLTADSPTWAHSQSLVKATIGLTDLIWWRLPEPRGRCKKLEDIIEWEAPHHPPAITARNIGLIPPPHREKLEDQAVKVAPGYKRTRGKQVLELRFDGIAGCLRTPQGGSSRQFLVIKKNGTLVTRLLTIRETARLMGAPDKYKIPGTYNDGYKAMGDAVAVPVAEFLAKHLLVPITKALHG